MDANSAIHCKNCHTLIQIPMPDPIVKKLPCTCGITEKTRIIRYWATIAGIALLTIGTTIMTTCHTTNYAGVEQVKNEVEKTKIINDIDLKAAREKLDGYRKENQELVRKNAVVNEEILRLAKELESEKKKSSPLNKWLDKKEAEQAPKED